VIFDVVHRLEADPNQTDLARGFRAETADPAWYLGRQWQLGEHQGEDASSPVSVAYRARSVPIEPVAGQPLLDPAIVPAEAIVESEPDDFWTPGRRVAIGRLVAAATTLPSDPELLLAGLPKAEGLRFPDSAHLPSVERAEQFTSDLRAWLAAHAL